MTTIPRESPVAGALHFLQDGYGFIQKRTRRLGSDLFLIQTPVQDVVCISGEEAARIFYDTDKFERTGAIPKRVQTTLMGVDAIQTLDGVPHHDRKAMFMSLMTAERIQALMNRLADEWNRAISRWASASRVTLFTESQKMLCRAACAWAGIPLAEAEVERRAADFADMIDAFGGVGPRHWQGKAARSRTEAWLTERVRQVRSGELTAPTDSALSVFATHRGPDGQRLDAQMAAIEVINVVRPIVAISWYVTFAALALHDHPARRAQLQGADADVLERFVHEVRRFYPFAPFLGNHVRQPFVWRGFSFAPGMLVLLDVYGTNRDPRLWELPHLFWPERFPFAGAASRFGDPLAAVGRMAQAPGEGRSRRLGCRGRCGAGARGPPRERLGQRRLFGCGADGGRQRGRERAGAKRAGVRRGALSARPAVRPG